MAATPSPNYNDQQILAADPTFQLRVRQSLVKTCLFVKDQDPKNTPYYRERETFAAAVMNSPDSYKELVAVSVATASQIMNAATTNGTIPLTTGNVAAQQALVPDATIDTAIQQGYNTFFRTPAS